MRLTEFSSSRTQWHKHNKFPAQNGTRFHRTNQPETCHTRYDAVRERAAARRETPAGQEAYRRRMAVAESPFGIIKNVMKLRQFLLRGIDKVRTEWRWAVTAFNLAKLVRFMKVLRAVSARKGGVALE